MDMRHQRPYNNRRHDNRPDNRGPRDEYSNLMTTREKEWVIKIQMLQLQSNNPYIDDYYYQVKEVVHKGSFLALHISGLVFYNYLLCYK